MIKQLIKENETATGLPIFRESPIKSKNLLSRHSGPGLKISRTGSGQNPVKSIVCWMLVFTSMTVYILNQRFLKSIRSD